MGSRNSNELRCPRTREHSNIPHIPKGMHCTSPNPTNPTNTSNQRMTTTEVSNGLVLPYAAITIAGKGGAAAVLLITFMACTSTLSAQVIAVSSILSFDVYREYFKKKATDRDLIRASHFGVIFFAVFSAAFSTMLHYVGINLGWTLYMLGTSSPTCSLSRTNNILLLPP
jgi:Na+/proline symporter